MRRSRQLSCSQHVVFWDCHARDLPLERELVRPLSRNSKNSALLASPLMQSGCVSSLKPPASSSSTGTVEVGLDCGRRL